MEQNERKEEGRERRGNLEFGICSSVGLVDGKSKEQAERYGRSGVGAERARERLIQVHRAWSYQCSACAVTEERNETRREGAGGGAATATTTTTGTADQDERDDNNKRSSFFNDPITIVNKSNENE